MALTENDVKVLTKALEYANKEEKKIIENILKMALQNNKLML